MSRKRRAAAAAVAAEHDSKNGNPSSWPLPKDWAQNLSHSYADLREEYDIRRDFFQNKYPYYLDDVDEEGLAREQSEELIHMNLGSSEWKTSDWQRKHMYRLGMDDDYSNGDEPKAVLFRHLFREWLSGSEGCRDILRREDKRKWTMDEDGFVQKNGKVRSVPYMRWPCQIESDTMSLRDLVRREFRAPSVQERIEMEGPDDKTTKSDKEYFPPSSYVDNHIRVQTAFHALYELNRKIAWGEKLGLISSIGSGENNVVEAQERRRKRLMQAAKGVTHFLPSPVSSSRESSDIFQCGTYLVAHPVMTGYLAKSVIVILDHTTSSKNHKNLKDEMGPGGTYGLIINRLSLQPVKQEERLQILRQKLEEKMRQMKEPRSYDDSENTEHSTNLLDIMKPGSSVGMALQRPFTLLQALGPDDLAQTVQTAFGDEPLRDGGPVNLSIQMMHRKCVDSQHRHVNGSTESTDSVDAPKKNAVWEIGGTQIPSYDDTLDTDAIFFGGDVVKASLAVADGSADQADFSFIVGASCWTPGQLQREIERGCWLPFRGPANMAMTG